MKKILKNLSMAVVLSGILANFSYAQLLDNAVNQGVVLVVNDPTDLMDPMNPLNRVNPASPYYDNSMDLTDPTNVQNYSNPASPLYQDPFNNSGMGSVGSGIGRMNNMSEGISQF